MSLTASARHWSWRAILGDRFELGGRGRPCPIVAWTEPGPALERASERARLGKPKRKGDVCDRTTRVFDVAQREIFARVVDQLQIGRFGFGELALQRTWAHVKLLGRV